jgi:hypothetical protein
MARNIKAEREARRAAGICTVHGCETPTDKWMCDRHRQLANRTAFIRRERWKMEGRCRECDRPTHHGFVRCDLHMRKVAAKRPDGYFEQTFHQQEYIRDAQVGTDRRRNGVGGRGLLWALKMKG